MSITSTLMVICFMVAIVGLVMVIAFAVNLTFTLTVMTAGGKETTNHIILCLAMVLLGLVMAIFGAVFGFRLMNEPDGPAIRTSSNEYRNDYRVDILQVGSGIVTRKPDHDLKFGFGTVRVDKPYRPAYTGDWSVLMEQGLTHGQRVEIEFQCAKRNGETAASGFVARPLSIVDALPLP